MAWFRKDKKPRFQPEKRTSQIPKGLWIKRIGDSSRLVPDPEAAEALMAGCQAYPYAQRGNPRKTRIIAAKGQKWSGWPEGAMEFWRLLAKMLAFAQDRANNALGLGAQVLIASTACSGSLPGPLRAATPPAADRPRISTSR